MNRKIIGGFFLLVAIIITVFVIYQNSERKQEPLIFSRDAMLDAVWVRYKQNYLEPASNRTLDKQRDNITTSEGQSYSMLRSVWSDDKPTFDISWKWAKDNLKRPDDNLFAWLYGKRADNSYGILTVDGGNNTATDGDTDIAVALLFASSRWGQVEYRQAASAIISDIWNKDVVQINGKPYITASNTESVSTGDTAVINPSYLSPYAYRMFAEVDPLHNWNQVVDSSYEVLSTVSTSQLDTGSSAGLPPDWVFINKTNGKIIPAIGQNLTSNFGYDAMRLPWRLALDFTWYGDVRAKNTLQQYSFLGKQWSDNKKIAAVYSHDGKQVAEYESPAIYGGIVGYFKVINPTVADEIYNTKLKSLYSPDTQSWKEPLGYYEDNWAWFGLALVDNQLPNLFSTK